MISRWLLTSAGARAQTLLMVLAITGAVSSAAFSYVASQASVAQAAIPPATTWLAQPGRFVDDNRAPSDGAASSVFQTPSAISNNTASGGSAQGGGIQMTGNVSSVTSTNSTISGNSAAIGGGIAGTPSAPTLTVTNSTIASNTIVANNTGGDCSGVMTSQGNNLDSDTCPTGAQPL